MTWNTRRALMRSASGCVAIAISAGCASVNVEAPLPPRQAGLIAAGPTRRESIAGLIAGLPMGAENIARRPVAEGEESTIFLVRIGDREQPHRHTRYDMTVILVEGAGTLHLDGKEVPMAQGDVAQIPRRVPHYFVNRGKKPASALVVFSPKFSGPDSEPTQP